MEVERKHVNHQWDDDETEDTEADVLRKFDFGHLEIAKLVPQILGSV